MTPDIDLGAYSATRFDRERGSVPEYGFNRRPYAHGQNPVQKLRRAMQKKVSKHARRTADRSAKLRGFLESQYYVPGAGDVRVFGQLRLGAPAPTITVDEVPLSSTSTSRSRTSPDISGSGTRATVSETIDEDDVPVSSVTSASRSRTSTSRSRTSPRTSRSSRTRATVSETLDDMLETLSTAMETEEEGDE
jgi:hypothetical protein